MDNPSDFQALLRAKWAAAKRFTPETKEEREMVELCRLAAQRKLPEPVKWITGTPYRNR